MANTIGPITLPNIAGIPTVSFSGNVLSFEGFFDTREELLQFQEMFRKAEGGTTIHELIGGVQIGHDVTEGSVLTQYCTFDAEHVQDGYYLLRSIDCNFEKYDSYFPFSVKLFFLGTTGLLQGGYTVFGLEDVTNDWNI